MDRINQILAPVLRNACQITTEQPRFFPNTRAGEGRLYNPPAGRPTRPFPCCPAAISPRTTPSGRIRPTEPPPKYTPSSYALTTIPGYTLPHRPIHLVELCGGIAKGLESVLKAGHAVSSYTWANIDPGVHTATTHRLARLHNRHPLLLPPEAIEGWDTRLSMDAKTITPALFTHAFPAGVDLIVTSPLTLPQHLSRAHREQG